MSKRLIKRKNNKTKRKNNDVKNEYQKKKNKKQKEKIKGKICVKHKKISERKKKNLPGGDKRLNRKRSDFSYG